MIFDEFIIHDRPIAETRRRRAFKGAIRQRHVRLAYRQWTGSRQRFFRRFDVREELVVSQQMPNGVGALAFNCQNAQQAKRAFELKNQVVTGDENVICQMKIAPLESAKSR